MLIPSNPMVGSENFVVRLIVMVGGYFGLYCWKDLEDLGLVMRWGPLCGLLISSFEKFFKFFTYEED